jgi:hypothetical protein
MGEPLMSILYTSTTDKIVANTTTETSLLPAALVIPAGGLVQLASLRITIRGVYGTAAVPGTLRLRCKNTGTFGTLTFSDTGLQTPGATLSGRYFEITVLLTVRTAGGSASGFAQGHAVMSLTSATAIIWEMSNVSSGVVADTTTSNTFDVTAQWGTANALNSIASTNVIIEMVTGAG